MPCRNGSRGVASASDGVPRCAPSSGASRFGQHYAPLKARLLPCSRAFCLRAPLAEHERTRRSRQGS
jgi:hypothetical protein